MSAAHTHGSDQGLAGSPHVAISREHDQASSALQATVEGHTEAASSSAVLDLQRLAGNTSVGSLLGDEERSPVHDVIGSGGGAPLDASTRSFMESRLGADFSDVRIHTDAKSDESARAINARAYTVGTDVVFSAGAYQPDTDAGRHTLAHELTHVVQQKAGPVEGTPAAGGIRISNPSDSFEQAAGQAADAVAAGRTLAVTDSMAPAGAVQRATGDEEEEELQMLAAQRQDAESEEEKEEENPSP